MVKNMPADAGDEGSVPGLGRLPENKMAMHSSIHILENSMDREAGQGGRGPGAWRELQSMGWRRIRDDLLTKQQQQNKPSPTFPGPLNKLSSC